MKYFNILLIFCILCLFTPTVYSAGPDGYISIPDIYLYKSIGFVPNIANGYNLDNLGYGVARLEHTTWGRTDGGRTVLVGHTPGGFQDLHLLDVGDIIVLQMDGYGYTFVIYNIGVVHWTDDSVLTTPTDDYELILITCSGVDYRRIVKAVLNE